MKSQSRRHDGRYGKGSETCGLFRKQEPMETEQAIRKNMKYLRISRKIWTQLTDAIEMSRRIRD